MCCSDFDLMAIIDTPYRNPGRWRAVIYQKDIRHGTAGCFLSLVLIAPLFVRQYSLPIVAAAVVIYACLIVPALTNYFSASRLLLKAVKVIQNGSIALWPLAAAKSIAFVLSTACILFFRLLYSITVSCILLPYYVIAEAYFYILNRLLPALNSFYSHLEGFRNTSNQVVFLLICERLMTPEAKLSSFYFLLFYTVLAYLQRSLFIRHWSVSFHDTSMTDFLKLTTWYIAARLGKGVAMSFVLITFTIQFNHLDPDLSFIGLTFLYYLLTEKKWSSNDRIVHWVKQLRLEIFEEDEEFWVPWLIKTLPVFMSLGGTTACLLYKWLPLLAGVALYTNVLVPCFLLEHQHRRHFLEHTSVLLKYRPATKGEMISQSRCPVCLEALRVARVTPCNHIYHGSCLRSCLALSPFCPLCKRDIR